MLAIHNYINYIILTHYVANAYAKLSKCQQFTTAQDAVSRKKWLQTLMQSYQNVSNSQLKFDRVLSDSGCKRLCKVIKMLAIHNYYAKMLIIIKVANAYAKLSKCQQFTTKKLCQIQSHQLQTLLQSYQNVSNSQLQICWC